MKESKFTIKEISDLFDNTRGAIRFYEEKGLVNPKRDGNGFRYYDKDDLFQLFYLRRYTCMSLTFQDINEYFLRESTSSIDDILSKLEDTKRNIEKEISLLIQKKEQLEHYTKTLSQCNLSQIQFIECPEYISFQSDDFDEIFHDNLDQLKKLIQAMPYSKVNCNIIENDKDFIFKTCISIESSMAIQKGIVLHPKAILFPAAYAVTKVVRVNAEHYHNELIQHIKELKQQGLDLGYTPFPYLCSSLILVHNENGIPVEYYRIYIPVKKIS